MKNIQHNKLLLFDNCLLGICNMGCMYCREKSFEDLDENSVKNNGRIINLKQLGNSFTRITSFTQKFFDMPILKVSGYGEFFLLPDSIEILNALSSSYERIQVITNATRLNEEIIQRLAKVPGINICVSLDGHTPKLNKARTSDNAIIQKILDNIEKLREYNIPVEINSVLTKYNISNFVEFADYLLKRYDKLTCYPYPVRGFSNLSALGKENAEKLVPLLKEEFSRIMSHKEYIRRLISFIQHGRRLETCYVGYANLGIDPAGNILVCACSIKQPIGNVFRENTQIALERRKNHSIFNNFLIEGNIPFNSCRGCFTHYEVINLYLDGTITLKDVSRIPLFSGEETQERLKELKEKLNPIL